MHKILRGRLFIFYILALAPVSFAFANSNLTDIETAILQKEYEKAGRLAQELIGRNPSVSDRAQAKYYLGISLLRLNRYAQGRETFQGLLKETNEAKLRDKAYLGIIDSFFLEERYTEALEEAQKILRLSPDSEFLSLIYLKLARANLKLADWGKAREFLAILVKRFPDSMESHIAKQLLEEKQFFAVQLGAFLDYDRAVNLANELKDKGQYAYIIETMDSQQRKFYRVRVGEFAILQEAQELKIKLSELGYPAQIYP